MNGCTPPGGGVKTGVLFTKSGFWAEKATGAGTVRTNKKPTPLAGDGSTAESNRSLQAIGDEFVNRFQPSYRGVKPRTIGVSLVE